MREMTKSGCGDNVPPTEPISRKRPIPYRSANFFDNLEMNMEDEAFWANNREGLIMTQSLENSSPMKSKNSVIKELFNLENCSSVKSKNSGVTSNQCIK